MLRYQLIIYQARGKKLSFGFDQGIHEIERDGIVCSLFSRLHTRTHVFVGS